MRAKRDVLLPLFAFGVLATSAPAMASIKWSLGSCPTSGLVSSCTSSTATPTTPGLTYSAYSDTAGTSLNPLIAAAYVGLYGTNIGVTSRAGTNAKAVSGGNSAGQQETTSSPNHAMDNSGNKETLLLTFTSGVILDEVELGYESTDSDLSVLAYTGTGTPTLTGLTYGSLLANGWMLIGNYANVYSSTANGHAHSIAINGGPSPVTSSYWLIGAYNSTFGTGANLGASNDFVKLIAAYGSRPGSHDAPEPASLLLLTAGLIGITVRYRRRQDQTAASYL
jgi:hypothetical protein